MITYEIYANLRDLKKMRDVDVARSANIPPSTFSDWKKGKSKPKSEKLEKIRIALNISSDEWMRLQGIEQPVQDDTSLILSKLGISVEDFQLLKEIASADPETKDMIVKLLAFYKSKNN